MTRQERAIVAAAFATQGAAAGSTLGVIALFLRPVADEMGATLAEVSLGPAVMVLCLSLGAVVIGRLLDRYPARYVMLCAALAHATLTAGASQAASLWQLAAACAGIGAFTPALGPLASAVIVGTAVSQGRGRALGIANTGLAAGGLLFATLAGLGIEAWGWRATLLGFAALAGTITVTSILLLIPTELPRSSAAGPEAPAPLVFSLSPHFLLLALSFAIPIGVMAGWGPQLANFAHSLGGDARQQAALVGIAGALAAPGTYVYGALCDRFAPAAVLRFLIASLLLGFAGLAVIPSLGAAIALASLMGLSSGGMLPSYGALLSARFGPESLGRVMGFSSLCILPFSFSSGPIAGAVFDARGDYRAVLVGFSAMQGLALVALLLSNRRVAAVPDRAGPGA